MCVATMALWIWSSWYRVGYARDSYIQPNMFEERWILNFNSSTVRLDHEIFCQRLAPVDILQLPAPGSTFFAWRRRMPMERLAGIDLSVGRNDFGFHAFGFRIEHTHIFEKVWTEASCVVPLWLLLIGFAILPAIYLRRPAHPNRPGFCTTCGYDLRATPWRCPKCGTVPEKADQIST